LLALSFPKFGHGSVAFFALAPLLLAVHGAPPGRVLLLGYLTGVVLSVGTLYWTALVVVQYGGLSRSAGVAVSESPRLRVGLVQASIPQGDKWDPTQASEHVKRHLELSRDAAARGARLVVWPESAVPGYFDRSPALAAELRGFVRSHATYLLFGNDDVEDDGVEGRRFYVGAKMLTPEGDLALRYHKMRLVPFGEYVPLRPLLSLGGRVAPKLVRQVADFTPGERAAVGEADGARLGVTICYEAIFPDLVRRFAENGAELLVNVTNDAWYGRTSAPYQHFAMAKLRAVEAGRYLLRAANTGITAVVDPRGRVVARSELFERTVIVEDVSLLAGDTFYSRHGDVFAWACLTGAALATAATFFSQPGARRAPHQRPSHRPRREAR
jgi:apolipoprotein N-acyltransferase